MGGVGQFLGRFPIDRAGGGASGPNPRIIRDLDHASKLRLAFRCSAVPCVCRHTSPLRPLIAATVTPSDS